MVKTARSSIFPLPNGHSSRERIDKLNFSSLFRDHADFHRYKIDYAHACNAL